MKCNTDAALRAPSGKPPAVERSVLPTTEIIWVKQFQLIGDWSLALHSRDDGEWVGAILHANVLQADLLCRLDDNRAFATIRVPNPPRTTDTKRDIRSLFAPGQPPLDMKILQALAEVLVRELGATTQLVLSPVQETDPMHFIVVPPGGGTR